MVSVSAAAGETVQETEPPTEGWQTEYSTVHPLTETTTILEMQPAPPQDPAVTYDYSYR